MKVKKELLNRILEQLEYGYVFIGFDKNNVPNYFFAEKETYKRIQKLQNERKNKDEK